MIQSNVATIEELKRSKSDLAMLRGSKSDLVRHSIDQPRKSRNSRDVLSNETVIPTEKQVSTILTEPLFPQLKNAAPATTDQSL